MGPPSQLAIATGVVNRLVKEEKSYHKEAEQQKGRITKLEQGDSSDENHDFTLRQEKKALEETKAMLPPVRQKLQEALTRLEQQLEQDKDAGDQSNPEEITKAKEAVASASNAIQESA